MTIERRTLLRRKPIVSYWEKSGYDDYNDGEEDGRSRERRDQEITTINGPYDRNK